MEESSKKNPIDNADDEVSLKDLILKVKDNFYYLLRKWPTIIIVAAIGGAIGLAVAIFKKPTYDAELTFVLDDEKGGGGALSAYAGIASQFGINLGGLEGGEGLFTGDNIIEFLKSRRMIQLTLLSKADFDGKKELLVDRYVRVNKLDKDWDRNDKLKDFQFVADTSRNFLQDSLIAEYHKSIIKDDLLIDKLDKKLSILSLKVTSKDELFAKAFCEKLITNAANFYVKTRTKKSQDNLDVLTKQVDSVRKELNSAIGGVAAASDANPNANKAFQSLSVASKRRTVDVQANTAILTELVKNQELARMNLRNNKPLIQVLDRPILPLEKNKVGKLTGIVLGGFIAGFLCVIWLTFKRILKGILAA
ncbi:lipopolysaccharide biosynthesis protein [Olivibacter jilunii]